MQLITEKAAKIKLLILDVDGVLTDGRLHYTQQGEELKVFYVHDGLGIKLLQNAEIVVAIISSRQSEIVTKRMYDLGVTHVYQGQTDKLPAYRKLITQLNLRDEQVAYLGDDLPDLPVMKHVGLSIAVANANIAVLQQVDWITTKSGGAGAVREVCELIMLSQNKLQSVTTTFM